MPPRVTTIPDILTPSQINQLITAATKNRYRVFILTVYSMGLWRQHRNANWLFPNARGNNQNIKHATTYMNKSGVQTALKAILQTCAIKKKLQCILFAIATPQICSNSVLACGKFSLSLATKARLRQSVTHT